MKLPSKELISSQSKCHLLDVFEVREMSLNVSASKFDSLLKRKCFAKDYFSEITNISTFRIGSNIATTIFSAELCKVQSERKSSRKSNNNVILGCSRTTFLTINVSLNPPQL